MCNSEIPIVCNLLFLFSCSAFWMVTASSRQDLGKLKKKIKSENRRCPVAFQMVLLPAEESSIQ